jgi:hypothetical protein
MPQLTGVPEHDRGKVCAAVESTLADNPNRGGQTYGREIQSFERPPASLYACPVVVSEGDQRRTERHRRHAPAPVERAVADFDDRVRKHKGSDDREPEKRILVDPCDRRGNRGTRKVGVYKG